MPDTRIERQGGKQPPDDRRHPFQLDRDRILYSMAFRRLSGVTQVVSPGEGEIFHNRLTHSLKVAQVGRRLAEMILEQFPNEVKGWGELSPDVVESAALGHDLGHPPFGHVAEDELNRLVSNELCVAFEKDPLLEPCEGYEGNAQSFRILTELAVRRGTGAGLDLTRAVLNATLKYPWKFRQNEDKLKKYGAYACDDAAFQFARTIPVPVPEPILARSLEAQIMDWADDITYSVHDTEDFYRAGLIPLDALASNPAERGRFLDSILARAERQERPINPDREFNKIFNGLFDTLRIGERYEGTRDQQRRVYDFVSSNIHKFIGQTRLIAPAKGGEALEIPTDVRQEVQLLKELTSYVIENPALTAHQHGQRLAIRTLYEAFSEAVSSKNWPLFPAYYRERAEKLHQEFADKGAIPVERRVRLVADTIASLTDRQAFLLYHQFTGVSQSSMLDSVVV